MSEPGRDFVLVAEDTAAALVVATIVDRVIHEAGEDWQRDLWALDTRATHRQWRGLRTDVGPVRIEGIGAFSKKQNVAPKRKITTLVPGRGGAAVEVAKFFAALDDAEENAKLAVFACDLDRQEQHAALAEHDDRVRRARKSGNPRAECFIIALAKPEFEAWLIAGFRPASEAEKKRLEEQHSACSFDPCAEPHRLQSTSNTVRDAKNVLLGLCGTQSATAERVRVCVEGCPLDALVDRGKHAGLQHFIDQVRNELLPLL